MSSEKISGTEVNIVSDKNRQKWSVSECVPVRVLTNLDLHGVNRAGKFKGSLENTNYVALALASVT